MRSHGLGNDYLVCDPADLPFALTPERTRLICHRNLGVGSDGILVLAAGQGGAPVGLRIMNPDGSEAEKSGNGLRIFAKWLWDTGRLRERQFQVHTLGGIVAVSVETEGERARWLTVDMGVPQIREDLRSLEVDGERLDVVALSMGNPHCVVFRQQLDVTELRRLGPPIEHHPLFPNRTNVQLARPVARDRVEALVWERGAGETLASGSSACAVAAASRYLGLVDDRVTVAMQGGDLAISFQPDGQVRMRGPAEEIGRVTLAPDLLDRLAALASA